MGWIILTIIAALLFAGLRWFAARERRAQALRDAAAQARANQPGYILRADYEAGGPTPGQIARWLSLASFVVAGLWVLLTAADMLNKVDNGHVGLVYQFGAIQGQRGDGTGGFVFTYPWQTVAQVNVQVQSIQPPSACSDAAKTAHCLDAASNETQDVFISPTINIHVDPALIQHLYRTVGPDAQGVADAAVVSAKGQAQANDLINASLTPALIQYATVNKLAPDVKVILLPAGGAGMILNLGDLTGSTAAATP
jgi:regulator of protease activity HflC (stomatin/prohibitin superfamily)